MKPEALKDEELWDLEMSTGLPLFRAFQGLWMFADREGRFEWRPRALKSDILPYWDGEFDRVLEALESRSFIVRYTVDERDYGLVRNLKRHQRFDHKEPPSELPAPSEHAQPQDALPGPTEEKPGPTEARPGLTGGEGKGREQEGKGTGREGKRGSAPRDDDPPSVPGLRRVAGSTGVSRTYTMPCERAPQEYLDEALMAGVSREQATSTWDHYFGAGLPERGVERLYAWLVQRAKERQNSTARGSRKGAAGEAFTADRIAHIERLRAEEDGK